MSSSNNNNNNNNNTESKNKKQRKLSPEEEFQLIRSQAITLRNHILQCAGLPSDCTVVKAALSGIANEVKRIERDENRRWKVAGGTTNETKTAAAAEALDREVAELQNVDHYVHNSNGLHDRNDGNYHEALKGALKCFLKGFKEEIMSEVCDKMDDLKNSVLASSSQENTADDENDIVDTLNNNPLPGEKYPPFFYADEGKNEITSWHVPKDFDFPQADRETGWKLWLTGMPYYVVPTGENGASKIHPIRPFRSFDCSRLPKNIRCKFRLSWLPLFKIMEEGLADTEFHNRDALEYDDKALKASFKLCTETLKRKGAEYIFRDKPKNYKWSIATWSAHLGRSAIMKHGTDHDKAQLPAETTFFNKPRASHKKRRRSKKEKLSSPTKVARHAVVKDEG